MYNLQALGKELIIEDVCYCIDNTIYVFTNQGDYILKERKLINEKNSNDYICLDTKTYNLIDKMLEEEFPF